MSGTSPCPPVLGSLRQNTQDTRYYDLGPDLSQIVDEIASITSITVVRQDGETIDPDADLTITPTGIPTNQGSPNPDVEPPWLGESPGLTPSSPSPYPGKLYCVFWWEGAGEPAADGPATMYTLTVKVVTQAGRQLSYDLYQAVVPLLG